MMKTPMCLIGLAMLALAGCEDAATRLPVVLQASTGEPVTLQIPRGYIEEPKNPEGPLPNVILRIDAEDFSAAEAFRPESAVRLSIEPTSSDADAAHERQAAALRKHKSSEEAIVKSAEASKPGLIAYTYPNGQPDAQAFYFNSASGDVFVDCRRSVCKAYKTWKKRVHVRFDYQPVDVSDVQAVDAAIDPMLQSFVGDTSAAK